MFIKVSMVCRLCLVIFTSRKSSVFRTCRQVAGEVFIQSIPKTLSKKSISSFISHQSFIQTVKCFFFNQIIVYQSFYGMLVALSYF